MERLWQKLDCCVDFGGKGSLLYKLWRRRIAKVILVSDSDGKQDYVQLVAIKQDWMRVANMDLSPCSPQGGRKLVVNIAVCQIPPSRKDCADMVPVSAT